jgi:hypothetical protein
MRCNVDKTRWLSLSGAVTEGGGIYGRQWLPEGQWGAVDGRDEMMKSFGAEEYCGGILEWYRMVMERLMGCWRRWRQRCERRRRC